MAERLSSFLPRIAVIVLVGLGATAGLTFAAGQQIAVTPAAATPTAPRPPATLVVPDVRNQAFVFAKGQLQDLGFAWHVAGSVQGYAANMVVSQSPAPGTKLIDTGSPLVTMTLKRNGVYKQVGAPADASTYSPTPIRLADAAVAVAPTPKKTAPKKMTVKPKPAAAAPARRAAKSAAPARRVPDFVVPGARPEPLDEIPLPARAAALGTWVAANPRKTNAHVKYWLYQNAWIVAGARMGWWHGAQALRTLIAVDSQTRARWGIGAQSESLARSALAKVEARAK